MSSNRLDPTNVIAHDDVKFTVHGYMDLLTLSVLMAKELTDLAERTNTSCFPWEITLCLTVVKSSDSTES
jgi:hypothetical protein